MMCTAKKCGIRFQPPAIILIYENEMKGKNRQRIMPVRNFSKYSDIFFSWKYLTSPQSDFKLQK